MHGRQESNKFIRLWRRIKICHDMSCQCGLQFFPFTFFLYHHRRSGIKDAILIIFFCLATWISIGAGARIKKSRLILFWHLFSWKKRCKSSRLQNLSWKLYSSRQVQTTIYGAGKFVTKNNLTSQLLVSGIFRLPLHSTIFRALRFWCRLLNNNYAPKKYCEEKFQEVECLPAGIGRFKNKICLTPTLSGELFCFNETNWNFSNNFSVQVLLKLFWSLPRI